MFCNGPIVLPGGAREVRVVWGGDCVLSHCVMKVHGAWALPGPINRPGMSLPALAFPMLDYSLARLPVQV